MMLPTCSSASATSRAGQPAAVMSWPMTQSTLIEPARQRARIAAASPSRPMISAPCEFGWRSARSRKSSPAARVVRALAVDVDVDVAAARAPGTDGLRRVEIPDAHLEAEVPVGQRAHGTDVHDVARVVVLEILTREEADLRAVAAAEDAELAGAGDLGAEAHAARAEDAALGVQHHVRPERHRLWLVDLLVGHPRIVEPVLHVVDLQPALAGLVAHGTVERMVDEMEFHDRPPRLLHAVGLGVDHHAVGGERVARDGRPRRFVDVHHTEATLPGDREPRVIAIVRDLDAQPARGLDEVRADLDLDLLAVDGDLRHGSRTA